MKLQALARMWENVGKEPLCVLVGMEVGAATMENEMETPQTIKIRTTI